MVSASSRLVTRMVRLGSVTTGGRAVGHWTRGAIGGGEVVRALGATDFLLLRIFLLCDMAWIRTFTIHSPPLQYKSQSSRVSLP